VPNRTRAAVIQEPGRPWEILDLTYDEPRSHEVLVRIEAAGLCHSDEHLRNGDTPMRYPMVGGHEGAGVVEAVGPNVERVAVGDRVMASFIPSCGHCRACANGKPNLCDSGKFIALGKMQDDTYRLRHGDEELGGVCGLGTFSERMIASEYAVHKLPDDIPFEVGALLSCGVPTGWGSSVRAAGVRAGDTAVIYGAGGVGSNAVQGAALAGAGRVVVVDPNPARQESARLFGATHTFADHESALAFVTDVTWGRLAEHAIITVGTLTNENVTQALAITGKGGKVTVTALGRHGQMHIQAPITAILGYERMIQGALFGSCRPLSDLPLLMDLYREGRLKLDELISHRYTLDEINQGYEDLLAGKNIRGVVTF
jgi:S-(hydroxymethyl)glutathione dehydrogenase/alcohol dehydrogenase